MNENVKNVAEQERVESLADWYLSEQLDFDRKLIEYRYRTLAPHLTGGAGLELGPAEGVMTHYLYRHFDSLTVVDAAGALLEHIPDYRNVRKVYSTFEDYQPESQFDAVMLDHVLEHVDDPVAILRRAAGWLKPDGRLFLGVPNADSFHRLAGVKMGGLAHKCELNSRDHALGHRRVYTWETFAHDITSAGLEVRLMDGVFFKPLATAQIDAHWTEEMKDAFYELGKDFPQNAAVIFAIAALPQ